MLSWLTELVCPVHGPLLWAALIGAGGWISRIAAAIRRK